MAYPSTIAVLTNPLATQQLNAPSHSGIETSQNTELVALETFVGTESSVVGTLMYDIRSSSSNGGGHVQTANKGGTGQTSFNKGDLLIASSASVLSKLAVGTDGLALVADSTQTSGVNWKSLNTTYAVASVLSASVYGITFPNAVSSLAAGQSYAILFPTTNTNSVLALQVSSLLALPIKSQQLKNLTAGAIQSSMIGLLENDGVQYQFLNPINALSFNNGATTNNLSSSVVAQSFAHGLSNAPKLVRIIAGIPGGGSGIYANSWGSYNGSVVATFATEGVTTQIDTDVQYVVSLSGINNVSNRVARATITVDVTNINLTWQYLNAPTGTASLVWEVIG